MKSFEEAYREVVDVKGETPELKRRLRALYEVSTAAKANPAAVRSHLVDLLEYLCTADGRTDANCKAVDYLFCMGDWSWDALPSPYQDMFADMGGALHNAVTDPDISEAMQSRPEDLLERAKALS